MFLSLTTNDVVISRCWLFYCCDVRPRCIVYICHSVRKTAVTRPWNDTIYLYSAIL